MTKPSAEPRQWWIEIAPEYDEPRARQQPIHLYAEREQLIHTVEFAAYARLKKQNEVLLEEIERLKNEKYISFNQRLGGVLTLNRSTIVGLRIPNPQIVYTNLVLDSGAEVGLDMGYAEVKEQLDKFDLLAEAEGVG